MMNFAPVLIPTLNRYDHLTECLNSLKNCKYSDETELIIALDYPSKASHWEGYYKIKRYLSELSGFKKITVIYREENFGPIENFVKSIEFTFTKYDRIIFSEDDNIFSTNFLEYMNIGLEQFYSDRSINAICAYNYPYDIQCSSNFYLSKTFSAWGCGFWRNRNIKFQYSPNELFQFITKLKNIKALLNLAPIKIYFLIKHIQNKQPLFGDGVISLENIKYGRFCIFPTESKIRNIGHDGSGVHCSTDSHNLYTNQSIDINNSFEFSDQQNFDFDTIDKLIKERFRMNYKQVIYTIYFLMYYFLFKGKI